MKVFALILELVAMTCITYGSYLLHPAAAWIVGGSLLALAAYSLENQE